MKPFSMKFLRRKDIAAGISGFFFEKPSGFDFKPGQFAELSLIDPPQTDAEGITRQLSIASAPYERELMFATRMRPSYAKASEGKNTAFKRVLSSLAPGSVVTMEGPFGDFVLSNDASRPLVFLTGGIGITPFRSMVLRAAHEHLPHTIFLFYSNRQPEDAAFLEELRTLENPNFKLILTMTRIEESLSDWQGERGRITAEMIARYVGDLQGKRFYSAGPQAMVAGMRKILNDAGVDDDDIRTEEFSGY